MEMAPDAPPASHLCPLPLSLLSCLHSSTSCCPELWQTRPAGLPGLIKSAWFAVWSSSDKCIPNLAPSEERDSGSGLPLSPSWGHPSPAIWFFSRKPQQCSRAAAHFHSAGMFPPFACLPCWAGMRCQGMIGKTERDSSPPPHSRL